MCWVSLYARMPERVRREHSGHHCGHGDAGSWAFYLAGAFNLKASHIGLVMSLGPIVAALTGLPAGRLVDRFGAIKMCNAGLFNMLVGSAVLVLLAGRFGLAAYIVPLMVITAGYALFQAANNAAVLASIAAGQRGLIAGMLNLARNLGLITGASLMGALFAINTGSHNSVPDTIGGLRITFSVAMGLIILALLIVRPAQGRRTQ
jgi:MFS family permease